MQAASSPRFLARTKGDLYSDFNFLITQAVLETRGTSQANWANQVSINHPVWKLTCFWLQSTFSASSVTASLCNALILISVSLHKVFSGYPPTRLFFRCQEVTDLSVSHSRDKRERCLLSSRILWYFTLDFDWYVPLNLDPNQCAQTYRPVVGTEIQTCCNI